MIASMLENGGIQKRHYRVLHEKSNTFYILFFSPPPIKYLLFSAVSRVQNFIVHVQN